MFQSALASVRTTGLHQAADETIDAHVHPLFRTNYASDSLLTTFKVAGNVPSRKTWNLEQAQDRLAPESTCTFGLKTLSNRDWRLAKNDAKKRAKGIDPLVPEGPPISEARASLSREARASLAPSSSAPHFGTGTSRSSVLETDKPPSGEKAPLKRADKYYQALLKAEKARNETVLRESWENYNVNANRAAEKAKKKALKLEIAPAEGGFDSESEEEVDDEEEELEDPGPLVAYPGLMKVEVEVVVLRAPGQDKSDTESSVHEDASTPSCVSEKSEDEDGIDWAKELAELQEEFAEPEKAESDDGSMPDGLIGRQIGNVHDNSDKRTALGLGGTAFFVPEVERYALAPSLLPPPPRGEGHLQRTGHKRLKLKPRLPLEVSRHRWRDEHPYGCPVEDEFSPDLDALRSWEEKVRRVELYGTLNKFIINMPKPDGLRKLPKTDDFERTLDWELKDSLAWRQYIKRQRLIEMARTDRDTKKKADTQALMEGYKPAQPEEKKPEKKPMKRLGAKPEETAAPEPEPQTTGMAAKPIRKPDPMHIPIHPGGPPLKMSGPPSFQVGSAPPSPPASPPSARRGGLMSVAPGVRHGLY